MNKELPKAGDIWLMRGVTKDHIIEADNTTVRIAYFDKIKRKPIYVNYLTKEYIAGAVYLGKAKGSIEDLFEVKEEK